MTVKALLNKIRRIPGSISFRLQLKRRGHLPPVYNCVLEKDAKLDKKALLSYITTPFRLPADHPNALQFSNNGIARSMARVLNQSGYSVDVIEYTDTVFQPKRPYGLFIGHLGNNYEQIANALSPETPKLYFATTPHWRVTNQAEVLRFQQLEERRGVRLQPDRRIEFSEDAAYRIADGIICLGNASACDSYSQFPRVRHLNNASYADDRYERVSKDFQAGRNHFLFFSGPGNVHKGLDLLLEAFALLDAHLYICQILEPDFASLYRHELTNLPNIHVMGHVAMRSPQFYELMDRCDFTILPSCGEGQPGSVVECLHQGLIPIVSRECHIDTEDYGLTLPGCSVEEITQAVQEIQQRSPEQLQEMSQRTRRAAVTHFSEAAFLHNLSAILQSLIGGR